MNGILDTPNTLLAALMASYAIVQVQAAQVGEETEVGGAAALAQPPGRTASGSTCGS